VVKAVPTIRKVLIAFRSITLSLMVIQPLVRANLCFRRICPNRRV